MNKIFKMNGREEVEVELWRALNYTDPIGIKTICALFAQPSSV
jgi:hypothetical protein